MEKRFAEIRYDAESGTITGTAIRFGDTAKIGSFSERFEPGSIRYDDVIANIQHDRAKPVARTGAGLTLQATGSSLDARIELPDTVYAREAKELVDAKIIRGMSLEFRADKERWDGKTRIIERATVVGLGLVDRPAYSESQIAQRFEETAPVTRRKRALL